jgi:hypothetical protein
VTTTTFSNMEIAIIIKLKRLIIIACKSFIVENTLFLRREDEIYFTPSSIILHCCKVRWAKVSLFSRRNAAK